MKKYRVSLKDGFAYSSKLTANNSVIMHKFKICVDEIGAYIIDKKQKIYLTEDNCVVI